MEHLKLMLFPDTPIQNLLAIRPMAMRWLETWGINPYVGQSERLEDCCRISGLRWDDLLKAIKDLETPERGSDWSKLPIYHLIDFITHEHRVFLHEFLPAIRQAFATGDGRAEFLGPLHPLVVAWPAFSNTLMEHISEEESFLFPKIMEYEYCLRHGGTAPDFSEGSVQVFAAVHLLREEKKQIKAIQDFLDASRFFRPSEGTMEPAAAGVYRLLQAFHQRLQEHTRMEREILFPLAGTVEKRVYDRHIEGVHAGIGHARHDSGMHPLLP